MCTTGTRVQPSMRRCLCMAREMAALVLLVCFRSCHWVEAVVVCETARFVVHEAPRWRIGTHAWSTRQGKRKKRFNHRDNRDLGTLCSHITQRIRSQTRFRTEAPKRRWVLRRQSLPSYRHRCGNRTKVPTFLISTHTPMRGDLDTTNLYQIAPAILVVPAAGSTLAPRGRQHILQL